MKMELVLRYLGNGHVDHQVGMVIGYLCQGPTCLLLVQQLIEEPQTYDQAIALDYKEE